MEDDEAAFRAFVTARWASLVRTAYLVTTDSGIAEDCVQEAMVRVHRHWGRIHPDGAPTAYAHKAVLNAALSWRRRRRIREVPLDPGPGPGALAADRYSPAAGTDPTTAVQRGLHDVDDRLVAALRSLPPQMRAVVALRYLEDRSEAETARLLGVTTGTVKSTASRGLARLRSALTEPSPLGKEARR